MRVHHYVFSSVKRNKIIMAASDRPASSAKPGQKKAKQRIRALDLIQKLCGPNNREAQKTKWAVELVMGVDRQNKQDMAAQQQQIADLQQQLADLQQQSTATIQQLSQQVESLQAVVQEQMTALDNQSDALAAAEVQCTSMQACLRGAEGAAAVAASECDALVKIVQTLINQNALMRSKQAHRADALRNELQQTHAALRRAADKDRGAQDERERRLRAREQLLTAERASLLEQQSVHAARDEALEHLQLKYHLSVCKIKELLRSASQQADSAAAAVSSGACHHQPGPQQPQAGTAAHAAAAAGLSPGQQPPQQVV